MHAFRQLGQVQVATYNDGVGWPTGQVILDF